MEFTYRKVNNGSLLESISHNQYLDLSGAQNYNPLYKRFFDMNEKSQSSMTLNNKYYLDGVDIMTGGNTCKALVRTTDGIHEIRDVFFKYSPLMDPSKYMIGRYDITTSSTLELPDFSGNKGHPKTKDPNNSAYVDAFFTYLTSQLLHQHAFPHAIDFYGSFLAQKNNFRFNIADDIEYLNDSKFFHDNRGTLFSVDDGAASNTFNFDSRKNKDKLVLCSDDLSKDVLKLDDIMDLSQLDSVFTNGNMEITDSQEEADLVFTFDLPSNKEDEDDATSSCSSRSSVTEGSDEESENDDEESDDEDDEDDTTCSTASEDELMATINQFPVQVIALERCKETLDQLITDNGDDLSDEEWGSMAMQIIMMLLAYQKSFGFTHNDLHTNNVMYNKTDKSFLYYKCDGRNYKVPTFGRIFKIIDFGRAIYKFRGNVVCSDSYHHKGDAATQYNFEPYLNPDKPRLEPNPSFDLCRLGCSLYDFIADDVEAMPKGPKNAARRMIMDWCTDDKGRNMLYKNNGEERYPDFKLYKMIARSVHKHTPHNVLCSGYFERFTISRKKISKKATIINIDALPSYS
jgi:hypothetical protein